MSYEKFAGERRSPSSDEFEEDRDKTVSFPHSPIPLRQMADRNFEGPAHAKSGSSKPMCKCFWFLFGAFQSFIWKVDDFLQQK